MSRDMKPKRAQPVRKKTRGNTLIGVFIGLVIGVGIAGSGAGELIADRLLSPAEVAGTLESLK